MKLDNAAGSKPLGIVEKQPTDIPGDDNMILKAYSMETSCNSRHHYTPKMHSRRTLVITDLKHTRLSRKTM